MDIRRRTTLLVAIGIIAASCSGATATDTLIDDAAKPASTAGASLPSPTEAVDVEIRMRRDVRSSNASSESPQMATLRTPAGVDGSSPVVVLLHGAGGSTRQSLEAMAATITDLGVPVLNASWAASPAHPRESAADAVCAVAYAYEKAALWGANPDRVVVIGHSGGGHVGMLAALAPEVFPECPTSSDAHVWAYIGLAGDPTTAAPGGNLYPFWKDYPEILAVMDATNHIGGNPDLIARFVHGTADGTVKIERTIAFSQALIDAAYDSIHIPVEGASHGDPANPTTEAGIAALAALQELMTSTTTTHTAGILSTTVARPSQTIATCPAGTDPDQPGPTAQVRPFRGSTLFSTALDRQSGQVVALGVSGEAWAFDVCTNTWARVSKSGAGIRSAPIVVYDADSDLVVAFDSDVRTYDVETDTWTTYSKVPDGLSYGFRKSGIYDPISGLIVVRDIVSSEMWAYDVDTDVWTSLPQGTVIPPGRPLADPGTDPIFTGHVHVYDSHTDSLVLYLTDNFSGPGIWEGAGTEMTWTYDLRAGEWTIEDTVTPELNFGWVPGPGLAAYDEKAETTVVVADGVVAGYDAALHEWNILWESTGGKDTFGMRTGPHNRVDHTIVYDPTNERIIIFGGSARMLDQDPFWIPMNGGWAFDTFTGTWSQILESSAS